VREEQGRDPRTEDGGLRTKGQVPRKGERKEERGKRKEERGK
jgi:hypothetical protein